MEQRQVMGEWAGIQNGEGLGLRWVLLSAWHVADTQKCLDCIVSLLLMYIVGLGVGNSHRIYAILSIYVCF